VSGLTLEIVEGRGVGRVVVLNESARIGRDPACDVVLDDELVSRIDVHTLEGAALLSFRAEARTQLARTLVMLGELGEARRQAELARAEVGPDDGETIATARWALAVVCAAEGRPDDAGRLYQEACERIGLTGYRVTDMDIQRDYARFLIETGRPAEARPLLEAVRAFYNAPETSFERERTDTLLQRCAAVKR